MSDKKTVMKRKMPCWRCRRYVFKEITQKDTERSIVCPFCNDTIVEIQVGSVWIAKNFYSDLKENAPPKVLHILEKAEETLVQKSPEKPIGGVSS